MCTIKIICGLLLHKVVKIVKSVLLNVKSIIDDLVITCSEIIEEKKTVPTFQRILMKKSDLQNKQFYNLFY